MRAAGNQLQFTRGRNRGYYAVAVFQLECFRFLHRDVQTDRKVVGEVVAAYRDHGGMSYRAFKKNNQFGGTSTDVNEAGAKFPLVRRDCRFGGGDAFKHGVRHLEPGFVGAGDDALRRARGTGGDMQIYFQPVADHPDWVMNARLLVEDKLLR